MGSEDNDYYQSLQDQTGKLIENDNNLTSEATEYIGDNKNNSETQLIAQKSWKTSWVRWGALFLACFLMVGNYMSYDFPAYLQNPIGKTIFGCENYENDTPECKEYNNYYPWLYTIYSLPNCILPFFGGFFVDKIGVRVGLILFTGILTLGQLFVTLSGVFDGGWYPSAFIFMYIGRFIFGLGGENQTVTQSTIVSKWFQGKELAFALGLNISCARLGSFVGSQILPAAFNADQSLTFALSVAEMFCIVSFCAMLGLVFVDKKAEQQEGKVQDEDEADPTEQVNLKDVRYFPLIFWLLAISCLLNYQCLFVFIQFSQGFFESKFGNNDHQAATFAALPYLISAGLTPFIGILSDKIGKRQWLLLGASITMTVAHTLLLVGGSDSFWQYLPIIMFGLFYSCYAAVLWPCIPLVLKSNFIGTGYGVTTAIQNFGLTIAPLLVNAIIKGTGYSGMQLYFIGCGAGCVLLSIWVIILDARTGGRLSKVSKGPKSAKLSRASMTHR